MSSRLSHIVNHLQVNPTASKFTNTLTYVLITGSNRGIGYGLVEFFLKHRANYFVIATCRNPNNAKNLSSLIHQYRGRSMIIQLDTASKQSIQQSVQKVNTITDKLHILINNAAMSNVNHPWENVLEFDETETQQIFQTNVIGPALMFKYYHKLLSNNANNQASKVINVSSYLGSLTTSYDHCKYNNPNKKTATSYRLSKAALNMLTRCQSAQIGLKDNIIVLSLHPGHVDTDMGTSFGKRTAPIHLNDAIKGICKLIENMNMKQHNGMFYDWKHKQIPW